MRDSLIMNASLSEIILKVRREPRWRTMKPEQINDGLCDEFASDVRDRLPVEMSMEVRVVWLGEAYHPPRRWKELVDHAVLLYRGHYYDAETPQGVPAVCPMLIPAWARVDAPLRKAA